MIKKILHYLDDCIAKGLGIDNKHPENRLVNAYFYDAGIISRYNHLAPTSLFDKIMNYFLGDE